MRECKYEQAFSEYKKWRSLIDTVVGENITVLSKKNHVRTEYGESINAYEISNS